MHQNIGGTKDIMPPVCKSLGEMSPSPLETRSLIHWSIFSDIVTEGTYRNTSISPP